MRRLLRDITIAAALLGCLTTVALGSAAGARPAAPVAHKPMYWGAWLGNQITGAEPPWNMSAVSSLEQTLGKGLSLLEFAAPLAECSNPDESATCRYPSFPTAAMQTVREYGAIPFLSWSSTATPETVEEPEFQLSDIDAHRYDQYIAAFAREAAAWGHPFFLRFDWEMNGNWFPWGAGVNGNTARQFVNTWRHVHDIFEAAGATNVTWVWCPYAAPAGKAKAIARFYPGNRYVDWTCIDTYNFGKNGVNPRPWRSFSTLLGPTYELLTNHLARGKPVVLGELASNGPAARKSRWISQMFGAISRRYPAIRGLIWFDRFDRDLNWPLETARGPTSAFRAGLRSNPFLGNQFAGLDASPIPAPH